MIKKQRAKGSGLYTYDILNSSYSPKGITENYDV